MPCQRVHRLPAPGAKRRRAGGRAWAGAATLTAAAVPAAVLLAGCGGLATVTASSEPPAPSSRATYAAGTSATVVISAYVEGETDTPWGPGAQHDFFMAVRQMADGAWLVDHMATSP